MPLVPKPLQDLTDSDTGERAARLYALFERSMALLLMLGMAVVIVLATVSFLRATAETALDAGTSMDYARFQVLFDRILAAVIAIELAHSVQQMVAGKHGMIQVRTVIVIGLLAVVRKLILLNVETTSGVFLVGIAVTVLCLGVVFVMIGWMENRFSISGTAAPGDRGRHD